MSFVNSFSNSVCCHFVLLTVSFALQMILSLIRSLLFIFAFISVDLGVQFSSVTQSCLTLCNPMDCSMPGLPVHHFFFFFDYSNSCPLSRWCHPTISSSAVPFSSRLQSFPASGSFQMSQFFASGGQRIGISASALILPVNIQDWFPLGWTGWISLQSNRLLKSPLTSQFKSINSLVLIVL